MEKIFVDLVGFLCVGVLPVATFVLLILFAGVLCIGPELLSGNSLSTSKIAAFLSGLVVFSLVALVGSNEEVKNFSDSFRIPGIVGLVIVAPCMTVFGVVVGSATIALVSAFSQKPSIAFIIAALSAGSSSGLYLYFTSQPTIRFGMAAGAIGMLLGSLVYIVVKRIEFHQFLFGSKKTKDVGDGDWPRRQKKSEDVEDEDWPRRRK